MGRKEESRTSSLAETGSRRVGSGVMSMGPIWALLMKLLGALFAPSIDGFGCVNDPVCSSVCGPPYVSFRGVGECCAFRGPPPPGGMIHRIPFFECGLVRLLFLGAGSAHKASESLFDFLEGAPSVGNAGAGLYSFSAVLCVGASNGTPIDAEGVLVSKRAAFSEVEESESVGISWGFRMS